MRPHIDPAFPHDEQFIDAGVKSVEDHGASRVTLDDRLPGEPSQLGLGEHVEGRVGTEKVGQCGAVNIRDSSAGEHRR